MANNGDVKSREKLKRFIHEEITKLFSSVLDYAEVAVGEKERYMLLRSKVLKVSNDAIREIGRELEQRYSVQYNPPGEEVIVISQKR